MELQNDSKKQTISPAKLGVGVALLVAAVAAPAYPEIVITAIVVTAIAIPTVWHFAEKNRENREAWARASSWKSIVGPEVIPSRSPNSTPQEVAEEAADFREQLRISGNPYAEIIPIVVFPYQPMKYGVGELTMSWPRYKREVAEQIHLENVAWLNKCPDQLKPLFLSQVMGLVEEKIEA
jgi:hypothetical protein